MGEEELRAVNRKSSDDVPSIFQVLQEFRAECGLVEVDRNVSVAANMGVTCVPIASSPSLVNIRS